MAESVMGELGVNNGGRIVFDRSKVRILVCDPSTSPDVVDLLRGCSYQGRLCSPPCLLVCFSSVNHVMFFRTSVIMV